MVRVLVQHCIDVAASNSAVANAAERANAHMHNAQHANADWQGLKTYTASKHQGLRGSTTNNSQVGAEDVHASASLHEAVQLCVQCMHAATCHTCAIAKCRVP